MKCLMKFKSMFNFCKRPFFEYAGKLFTESHSQISNFYRTEAATGDVLWRKVFLKNSQNFTEKHLCWSFIFNKVAGLRPETIMKETPAQVLFCEFCEIFKNTFFTELLIVAASVLNSEAYLWHCQLSTVELFIKK